MNNAFTLIIKLLNITFTNAYTHSTFPDSLMDRVIYSAKLSMILTPTVTKQPERIHKEMFFNTSYILLRDG